MNPIDCRGAHDAPLSRSTVVAMEHGTVAVFRIEDTLYAVDDACVRCGSALSAGTLHGADITCACCGWRYDVTTGCARSIPQLRLDTYEVVASGSKVSIAACRPGPLGA